MENKIHEFEEYLKILSDGLHVNEEIKDSIIMEIEQSLYDKYKEYLIKGYGFESSIQYTIRTFENPRNLSKMFQKVYEEGNMMPDIKKIIYNKKVVMSSFIIIFLMTVYEFGFSLYNFVVLASKTSVRLGWHAIDSNIINCLLLAVTLLVLYIGSLYNLLFKKLLPPKIIIWAAYINFILVLFFNFATK